MSKHRTKVGKRPLLECNHPQQQQQKQKQTTIENNKKMEYKIVSISKPSL
jgi:hypothetical protein